MIGSTSLWILTFFTAINIKPGISNPLMIIMICNMKMEAVAICSWLSKNIRENGIREITMPWKAIILTRDRSRFEASDISTDIRVNERRILVICII